MKFKFAYFLFILVFVSNAFSQISSGGTPYSYNNSLSKSIDVKKMPKVDVELLLIEDEISDGNEPYRFGYGFDVLYDMNNCGTWTDLPNGGKLWQLKIFSEGAYSINLIYDKFWMPKGSKFYIYNADKTMLIGAFTSKNNKPHKKFATGLVKGDEIILEYYEPKHIKQASEICISRIIHGYKNLFSKSESMLSKTSGFDDSESCNNNVYCTEAEPWEDEVHSVGMIVLGDGTRLCSGSLINNKKENFAPYFLTADHCLDGDVSTWIIWFNYESSTCSNPSTEPSANSLVGTTLKANNEASDFALLMLDETPPIDYNVYYNGWSNVNTAPNTSVCIHHPRGDIKKISYEDDSAYEDTYSSNTPTNSHWVVRFDDGTVEHGSSGSPLIDPNHRVVGQLHGDPNYDRSQSYCDQRYGWYGKFSVSWDYGSTSSTRLKDWLDPNSTGATTLNGMAGGMLSEGELPASATWSGTHSVTDDLDIPNGITLVIESGATINLTRPNSKRC